jgi:hypothetical protein
VRSGTDANFGETIGVRPDAAAGTYSCSVDFLVNGVSQGFVQTITVHVPGLSIGDVTVTEGDSGTTQASFTVTLDRPVPAPVMVHYTTADGTATAPGDYTASVGDVTFAAGQSSQLVAVPVVGDTTDEPDETFTVELSDSAGAAIVDGSGVGTIVDDDRDGAFSCTATALTLLGNRRGVANPSGTPCRDSTTPGQTITLSAGLVSVRASNLTASTDQTPDDLAAPPATGDTATATAGIGSTRISLIGLTVDIGTIESHASASCNADAGGLAPTFTAGSTITSLKINGTVVPVGSARRTLPLVVGSLTLNNTVTTPTDITQQAVVLHTLLGDVVPGEARAGITGNPCSE